VGGPNSLLVFLLSRFPSLFCGLVVVEGGVELASYLFCRPFRHALTASFRTFFSFLVRPLPELYLRNGRNIAIDFEMDTVYL
jgi:hypothetical protein